MSREHDQASEFEQMERDRALQKARTVKTIIEHTGNCLQCSKSIFAPHRWCDAACRDDWQAWNPGT